MDAALGTAACPEPGVAAAAANVTSKRKFRRRTVMLPSLSWFRQHLWIMLHPLRVRLKVLARPEISCRESPLSVQGRT